MADGEVKINTKLDTSGVDKGLKDLNKKLDDAGKSIDNAGKKSKLFGTNLGGISKGALATAGAVAGVAVAVKKTVDALNDCEAAYKVQLKAETALANAAKNNPYLNNESVYNLRAFASELQSMSEIGDEQSLQVMAQLAAMGRTEEQIQAIMKAAADMSAVTGNSIQNIAVQLNKTYSGLSGELGEANSAIRALSKEELEAGKAIDIIAQQYNGSAAAMADNTVQLANAWGDFKENIGRGWSKVTQPVKEFFLGVLNDINEATSKTNALKDANNNRQNGTANTTDLKVLVDNAKERAALIKGEMDKTRELLDDETKLNAKIAETRGFTSKATYQKVYNDLLANYTKEQEEIRILTVEYGKLSAAEKKEADEKAAAAAAAKAAADKQARNQQAADFITENKGALADKLSELALKAELTDSTKSAAYAQEVYNAYMQSYIDLITKSNGLVTANNEAAKERATQLQQMAQAAAEAQDAEERLAKAEEIMKATEQFGRDTYYDTYKNREQELLAMKQELNAAEVEDEERKKEALKAIDDEIAQNRKDYVANMAAEINGYIQQVQGMIDDAAKMALETSNNQMKAELANLEIKYRKGELGEEEYQKKVAEAKKKGAKIQYQIEMAQWAANILTATANTAVGVTQALAQGGVAGIITGALVGAAGAVQLASIMAAKPIQHFATGGFVGGMNGATMGADNTTIAARNGEMIMNANQQRALWDMLNGVGTPKAGGYNLIINNSAANLVSAQPQLSRGQIEIMIDARVNDGLKNGRFNSGLNAAQAGMSGEFYGM